MKVSLSILQNVRIHNTKKLHKKSIREDRFFTPENPRCGWFVHEAVNVAEQKVEGVYNGTRCSIETQLDKL
jgi:hypothetical protein